MKAVTSSIITDYPKIMQFLRDAHIRNGHAFNLTVDARDGHITAHYEAHDPVILQGLDIIIPGDRITSTFSIVQINIIS